MDDNKMKIIDFSEGIRSNEIQHNFNAIQYQLNKERTSVAGSGISYGLDFKLNNFNLEISKGCLISSEGEEIYIANSHIEIEKPILIAKEEKSLVLNTESNSIRLSEIPYAINRLMSSNKVPISESGISATISNMSGSSAVLNISSTEGRTIYIDNKNNKPIKVDVKYYYTAKRRDIIFIDKNYKIKYRTGITSTSPSIPEIKEDEYIYILGYIEVDGMKNELIESKPNNYIADASIIKEFQSVRNVYTDNNNKLYLCGTPFDSIKVIHMTEPKNPEVDTFWYDLYTNKLKIWRRTDMYEFSDAFKFTSSDPNNPQKFTTNIKYLYNKEQISVYINNKKLSKDQFEEGSDLTDLEKQQPLVYSNEFKVLKKLSIGDVVSYSINRYDGYEEWVAVNDTSQVVCEERYIWSKEQLNNEIVECNHDLQFFFFDSVKQKNMLYTPNKNCLKVMIDQIPLHSDQYDEITIYDAIAGPYAELIKPKLMSFYGYSDDFDLNKINEEFENIGIGFKLNAPLDKTCYVEANVTHIVNSNPISRRFQRTATFVEEGSFIYKEYKIVDGLNVKQAPIFTTTVPFRYKENQIEVFKNGVLLERNVEYRELLDNPDTLKGALVSKFEILSAALIKDEDKISYRITTNVYSYDHVDGLLSGFDRRIKDIEDLSRDTLEEVRSKSTFINNKVEQIDAQLQTLINIENSLDNRYIKKADKITKENLTQQMYEGMAQGVINSTLSVTTIPQDINVTDIGVSSVNDFILLYNTSSNKLLQRDTDYSIVESEGRIILRVTNVSVANSVLYLTGIRFNKM